MKEIHVSTHEFKTHISDLIRQMKRGDADCIIVKNNKKPVGVFRLYEQDTPKKRKIGFLAPQNKAITAQDWARFDALDAQITDDFEGAL